MGSRNAEQELLDTLGDAPVRAGYRVQRMGGWLVFYGPDRHARQISQGWKLHISARPASLRRTLAAVLPLLLDEGCDFKIVGSVSVLREFNDGLHGIAAVGKALTVYPKEDRIAELGGRLADELAGFDAPRINSDRRLRNDAPVYYRFGPFSALLRYDELGYLDAALKSPAGEHLSGRAGETYGAPAWVTDPFGAATPVGTRLPKSDGAPVIGDHYRIVAAIASSFRGTTFRAVDLRSERGVIVKEAAAFVSETEAGDARSYLRNELEVLDALAGLAGVPAVIDHFAYGPDEYLVTSELGRIDLRDDVVENGIFTWSGGNSRSIMRLTRAIIEILDEVHARGVVVRDLTPKNVVSTFEGGWALVDFELGSLHGIQLRGWTPGYSSARQVKNQAASLSDDYYSLGATMFYAATGMDPIVVDKDPELNLARTTESFDAALGDVCPELVDLVIDLLSSDPDREDRAVARLRGGAALNGRFQGRRARGTRPSVETTLRHTLDAVAATAVEIAHIGLREGAVLPPVNAQHGTAGLIAELTLHSSGLEPAMELARFTGSILAKVESPPGLLYGRMGACVALEAAAAASGAGDVYEMARAALPTSEELATETCFDVSQGAAGLGLGYLALSASTREPEVSTALANACARRILESAEAIDLELRSLPIGNHGQAISIADGFAHGRAGIAYFLLAHAARTDDRESTAAARDLLDALAQEVPRLSSQAKATKARPMAASWCQGLAGIGAALARGAHFFDEEAFEAAARDAAIACTVISSRVPLVTQCCGLAGVGEFLIDMSLLTGEHRYTREAHEILALMLLRAGGSPDAPRFPASNLQEEGFGWGTGATGVLSFMRRLVNPASPRHWMPDGDRMIPSPGG